jgi:hypothetical protein
MSTSIYSGSWSTSGIAFEADGDDGNSGFSTMESGSVSINLGIDSVGGVSGTGTLTSNYSGSEINDIDLDHESFNDHGTGTVGLSGAVNGSVSFSGTLNDGEFVSFIGSFNSNLTVISGTMTVTDKATGASVKFNTSLSGTPPDRPPTVVPISVSAIAGQPTTILVVDPTRDHDPDGDPVTITSVSPSGEATATISGNSIIYTALASYTGPDTISYVVSDNHGNSTIGSISVNVTPPLADLTATLNNFAAITAEAGTSFQISFVVSNIGILPAGADTLGVYLSTDSTITTSDTQLGTVSVPAITNGQQSGFLPFTVTLPSTLSAGTYWIGGFANYNQAVTESNYNNNFSGEVSVTIVQKPTITSSSAQGSDSATGNIVPFFVNLSTAVNVPVTVQYTTQNVDAIAGTNYTATSGTLTFQPGQTGPLEVDVSTIGFTSAIGNKTFELVLSNPTNAQLPGNVISQPYTGTIIDVNTLAPLPSPLPPGAQWTEDSSSQVTGGEFDETSPTLTEDPVGDFTDPSGDIVGRGLDDLMNHMASEAETLVGDWMEQLADRVHLDAVYRFAREMYTEAVNFRDKVHQLATIVTDFQKDMFFDPMENVVNDLNDPNFDPTTFDNNERQNRQTFFSRLRDFFSSNGYSDADQQVIDADLDLESADQDQLEGSTAGSPADFLSPQGGTAGSAAAVAPQLSFGLHFDKQAAPDTIIGKPNQVLTFIGGAGNYFVQGSNAGNFLYAGDGNDTFVGGAGHDILIAGSGNDVFEPGPGTSRLVGGTGTTTAIYSGPRAAYLDAPRLPSGAVQITDTRPGAPNGVSTATGITYFQFSDLTETFEQMARVTPPNDFFAHGTSDALWRNLSTGEVDTWLFANGRAPGGTKPGFISSGWRLLGTGDFNGDTTSDLLWRNVATGEIDTWLITNGQLAGGGKIGTVSNAWRMLGTGDFNGDGTSDILWLNSATGEVATWIMNNGQVVGGGDLGVLSTAWQFAGIGDYNGDGTSDILWRNVVTGEVDTWIVNNGRLAGGSKIAALSAPWQPLGSGDFNADGTGDVLWRNAVTGDIATWIMKNGQVSGGAFLGTLSSVWQFAGIGDYTGNGTSDLLWRNTVTGELDTWLITNDRFTGASVVGAASSAWQLQVTSTLAQAATPDFNGDGVSDALWRNTSGEVDTWFMSGGHPTGGTGVGTLSSAWQFAGAGDVVGTGTGDMIWQNTATGEIDSWLINNGRIVSGTMIGTQSSAWQALGAGDFNGDGVSDLAWRNTATGDVDTWFMNNGRQSGGTLVGTVSSAWQFAGSGDVNGDGTADLLWHNTTTGEVDTWLINNGHLSGGTKIGGASSAWQALGTGDFNGNGTSDMLWRNTTTGEVDTWLMTNGQVTGGAFLGTVSTAWQFAGIGDYTGSGTSDVLWRNTTTGEVDTWLISNDRLIGGAISITSSAWQPQVIHTA